MLLTLLGAAGVNFIMGVPGADDVMLNYQSTSFHDALYVREALGLRRAPEFEAWLARIGLADDRRQAAGRAGTGAARARAGIGRHEHATRPGQPSAASPRRASGSAAPARRCRQGGAELRHGARAGARRRDHADRLGADREGPRRAWPENGAHRQRRPGSGHLSAPSRSRPPLERQVARATGATAARPTPDLLIVVADGLSSTGVAANAVDVSPRCCRWSRKAAGRSVRSCLASQARVALGDDAGEIFGARAVLVLIGERPGLSSPDSLGAYLTFAPRVGRKDGERNCVSNIRRGGLGADEAAFKIALAAARSFRALTDRRRAQGREQLSARRRCRARGAVQAAAIRK